MSDSKEHVPSSLDYHRRDLILGILIPGIVLAAMVLMAFAYTALQRRSRPHLHRVSLRLLVYATVSNFILSVTLIPTEALMTGPISVAGCTFAVFTSNASFLFSAGMYFCMALNLQLVLVHGVNGLKMEKYYLGPYNGTCWYNSPDPATYIRWVVGTLSFWVFLMASSELVCFFILVAYMLRLQMSVKRMRAGISAEMSTLQHAAYSAAPILQFRGIILRITLYPLLSCALNFSSSILALYLAKHLGNTELNFQLGVLDLCIFNARPFLYAVLAATDPSLIRAVSALRQPAIPDRSDTQHAPSSQLRSQSSRSITPFSGMLTLVDGSKAESESTSQANQSVDALERQQQTDAGIHNMHTHRDPEQGIGPDSSVVQSRKDSIEFQI
ncbi:hypothetical protein MVEN_02383000 [Mycena venus]|uniref:Uncharacterized protein n=1 Tax=Mycena venus TaxID=2733690 RepID=A0A8H6X2U5_9AGAR|nr:hypothetical protein MVEN_02383000 [Mycena venus]